MKIHLLALLFSLLTAPAVVGAEALCHPECTWVCDDPVCSARCVLTHCGYQCEPQTDCPRPQCELQCQRPACEAEPHGMVNEPNKIR
jgi:hypothetical protein